ncbi:MAG TPA: glycosyltransferase family 4 protein [Candidatus Saccharimonadales bacterium]|nr:glycosyltransferase family 4 protein [Candidatus Saccharimonadales bacterium]
MKKEVVLFQPSLRRFVLNFGRDLKHFSFKNVAVKSRAAGASPSAASFEKEINRVKMSPLSRFRRVVGLPNIRVRLDKEGDLFFTYGCLLITRKPYVTYIETGLALYNYDPTIASHPVARWLVSFLATRAACQKLIFVSEASKKSFFASVCYSPRAQKRLEAKSVVIYPIPIPKLESQPKRFTGALKLLFPGQLYIKGGLEVAHAYQRLRQAHPNVSLTMITALDIVTAKDQAYLRSLPGLTLLDAKLSEQEMIDTYRSHDIFVLPTLREGFGLVIVEALAYGLPVIITDQYATTEMATDGYNGFVYPNHPLKDYDPKTYQMFGRYYQPRDFYNTLFRFQKAGKLKPLENFLVQSVEKFIQNPALLARYSRNSLTLYHQKFDPQKLSKQFEKVLVEAVKLKA